MSTITIIQGNSNDKDNTRAYMVKGEKGYSAYDLYVQHGGTLTEEEWLDAFLNANNFYNKSEVDNLLDAKADEATTLEGYGISDAYTKTETNNLISGAVTDNYSTSTTTAYSANYVNNLTTYSTTAKRTGTWIDGKPVYTQVINYQTTSSTTNNTVAIDITSLSVDTLVYYRGVCTNQKEILSSDTQALTWNNDKTGLTIFFNNSTALSFEGYIIIEFTKTTD